MKTKTKNNQWEYVDFEHIKKGDEFANVMQDGDIQWTKVENQYIERILAKHLPIRRKVK